MECTGEEITQEWPYHMGVPTAEIPRLAAEENVSTVPVSIPFITSYFMPRKRGDRPDVVPQGSTNLAFIGNFAESPTRDTVFTTEYSVRTAMEAVYTLMGVDRGIPEVFGSVTDLRVLLRAAYCLRDRKTLQEEVRLDLPFSGLIRKEAAKKVEGTWIEQLLEESGLL